MYFDTHAHLNFEDFKLDYQMALERARRADVVGIINVGSNYETSLQAIKIAKENDACYAAVALHPIHTHPLTSRDVNDEVFSDTKYLKLAKNKEVVAIGETGLDYYYDKKTAALQKEVLGKLIKISQLISKPLILHCREAGDDLLPILLSERSELRGVMHCFQEDWQFAKAILEIGFYISFTGLITFTKNQKTYEVIKETPLEKILLETDCPYLTPEPYRGKRNEPAYVVEVAKKIAEIKKISLKTVEAQTTQNAQELFKINI